MKPKSPFIISSRLAPAIAVGGAVLSFSDGRFVIDLPDGAEHVITDFHFPRCRVRGATNESELQGGFASVLAFLDACAESRAYAGRNGEPGENADLFPENVGAWAESCSDEIGMTRIEIEETPGLITA